MYKKQLALIVIKNINIRKGRQTNMDLSLILINFSLCLLAYLSGAIPWGLVITRWFSAKDIRKSGSGNIGATNALRTGGIWSGLITLAADMTKGAVPVALAVAVLSGDAGIAAVSLAAFFGHTYSCFLRFNGGKGVATAAGCFLVMSPLACLASATVFIAVAMASRKASAASLGAALVLPMAVWAFGGTRAVVGAAAIMTVFIFVRHQANIRRLMAGTEPKFM